MENEIKRLSQIYRLNEAQFAAYCKKAIVVLKLGKTPSDNKTLLSIVGGQSGAGKSRLIPIANQELNGNAVIVDFDELRSLHPFYKEVSDSYPEITHRILHPDTERVKNEVLETLRKEGYNVIYEGALRNTQGFLDFANNFKQEGYNIVMHIMSVPKLESYGSTFVRYATDLLAELNPRWVEKDAHDGSYEGVIRTVRAFMDQSLSEDIKVYIRGEDIPLRIYPSEERQFENAISAIVYGREIGRKKAIEDFPTKFKMVKGILEDKDPKRLEKIEDWKALYSEELEYFNRLERMKGTEDR